MAKATADIRSLARAQAALAIRTLIGVCGFQGRAAAHRTTRKIAIIAPPPHSGGGIVARPGVNSQRGDIN
jgi:hypothetical protein